MQADSISHASEGSPSQLVRRVTAAAASMLLDGRPTLPTSTVLHLQSAGHDHSPSRPQNKTSALHDLIAGGIAGSAGIIIGHPLDSIKVRMQMMATSTTSGQVGATSTSKSLPSFRSLWKGVGAPLTMAAAVNATIFLTYGGSTRAWDNHFGSGGGDPNASIMKTAVCGGAAGIASSFIICPTEHIKTKLQTQRTASSTIQYHNSLHAARHIFSNHGLNGLYRGFSATLTRQVPGFVVYFSTYDRLKNYTNQHYFGMQQSVLASITAGGIAGSLSWAIVYPIDLIKSRIQALPMDNHCSRKEYSMGHVMKEVVRVHGWRALYRGFGITILRAFPVNGIIFPTYEMALKALSEV